MSYTITEKCNGCGACLRICPASAISGEKKKAHAIDSGSCIECGACGRICPHASVLDPEGALCVMIKRSEWLKPDVILQNCLACCICVDACPVGCLVMSELPKSKGVDAFPYLKETKACIGCGFCSRECPADAIVMRKPAITLKVAAPGDKSLIEA